MTNQFDRRPIPSKFDGVGVNTLQREKDRYGWLYCDKSCPAYNEEFCDAILDYHSKSVRMCRLSSKVRMCRLSSKYRIIEVKDDDNR